MTCVKMQFRKYSYLNSPYSIVVGSHSQQCFLKPYELCVKFSLAEIA